MLMQSNKSAIKNGDNINIITIDIDTIVGELIEMSNCGVSLIVKSVAKPTLNKYVGTVCFIPNTQITIIIKD